MEEETYLIATIRKWNFETFHNIIAKYKGKWCLVTRQEELTVEFVKSLKPRYIFFPHWSHIVPQEVLDLAECIGFHETDLPFGRGGSPIQNLIARGYKETMISAFRMTGKLDAGPIYIKRRVSLEGLAEEIFIRCSNVVAEMIFEIITKKPIPKEQEGIPVFYKRRKPAQSEIPTEIYTLEQLFDHIRMLDADEYPKAFLQYGRFRIEFCRPALRTGKIEADVVITVSQGNESDD